MDIDPFRQCMVGPNPDVSAAVKCVYMHYFRTLSLSSLPSGTSVMPQWYRGAPRLLLNHACHLLIWNWIDFPEQCCLLSNPEPYALYALVLVRWRFVVCE